MPGSGDANKALAGASAAGECQAMQTQTLHSQVHRQLVTARHWQAVPALVCALASWRRHCLAPKTVRPGVYAMRCSEVHHRPDRRRCEHRLRDGHGADSRAQHTAIVSAVPVCHAVLWQLLRSRANGAASGNAVAVVSMQADWASPARTPTAAESTTSTGPSAAAVSTDIDGHGADLRARSQAQAQAPPL